MAKKSEKGKVITSIWNIISAPKRMQKKRITNKSLISPMKTKEITKNPMKSHKTQLIINLENPETKFYQPKY